MDDTVTGARVDLTVTVDLAPERLWDLVSDVTRIGEWSPECVGACWSADGPPGPRAGARFEGHNRYPDGRTAAVACVVTESVRPEVFAWVCLDDSGDEARPASIWRYELAPADEPGRTVVRHGFVHGPGRSGARAGAQADPASLTRRLSALHGSMAATVAAMVAAAARGTDVRPTTEENR
jgi:uncharacterized protein YndB with AHSA1/START domain